MNETIVQVLVIGGVLLILIGSPFAYFGFVYKLENRLFQQLIDERYEGTIIDKFFIQHRWKGVYLLTIGLGMIAVRNALL